MATKIPTFSQKSRLPYLRPPPNKPLKRRLSSDEASLSLAKRPLRSDSNRLQGASNDCLNKLGRPSVTHLRVAKNPLQRSVSVVSLANHKKSEKTSLGDSRMKLIQPPKPKPVLQSSTKENSGKMKRPAWDLKGRLLDTEVILKQNRSKISDYENQMITLEAEKNRLQENLIQIKSFSDKSQEEISKLEMQLRNERNEKIQEKMRMDTKISELEKLNISLESQILGLKRELDNNCEEIQTLKATVLELENFKHEMRAKVMEGEMQRRLLHNEIQDLKGNIRVYCRVRPLVGEEIPKDGSSTEIPHIRITDEKSIQLMKNENHNGSMMGSLRNSNNSHSFSFDQVFAASAPQSLVYEEISQLVQSVLDGYNVCVFAYGQTGSGKTYTMEGVYNDDSLEGIIPRTIKHVFGAIEDLKEKGWKYETKASFLEIYNETIRDLLASPKEAQSFQYEIRLIDNKMSDICVPNLKVMDVDNASQVYDLLEVAHKHRAVAATKMNHRSSRSHSVFQLKLKGSNLQMGAVCEGTLNLVDLAGSERVKESGSEGMRLTEAQNINKSLANLGNVIMALSQKQKHIPYRNSKLTHLLQNSLGGNSKTLMFVNISPLDSSFNETLNSLRFATNVNQCQIGTAVKQVKK